MKKLINKLKSHYYLCYTMAFLVISLLVFSCFFLYNKSFIWEKDGLNQHLIAYMYYGRYLREIVNSLFVKHTLAIPEFSFSIGYGSDIMTTLSYYVIGDPICALTLFVPDQFMAYFYQFSIVLRLFLSGLTFSMFCLYINHKRNNEFSHLAIMVGTFVYVFSGFALYSSIRHPYFINPMIYFPLVLLGVEMILDKKNFYVLTLAVFFSAISNFYFFYMIVLLTIIYVIWRIISRYSRYRIKEAIINLGKITFFSLLGTLMSAVILFPTILLFLGDSRSTSGYIHDLFYTLSDYQKTLGSFISINTQHDWLIMGYASIALISIILLFINKKENKNIKILFLIGCVMLLVPILGKVMNGFSYVSNRWIWGFNLLIGYIVVVTWDKIFLITSAEYIKIIICLCLYFVLCLFMPEARSLDFIFSIAIAFLLLSLFSIKREDNIIKFLCATCVFINIIGNAYMMYSPDFNDYVSEFIDNRDLDSLYQHDEAFALNSLIEDDEFSRYSGSIQKNRTLLNGLSATQYYWSLSNGNISKFQQELALNYNQTQNYKDLDSKTCLNTLANVKYFVKKKRSSKRVPYGYEEIGKTYDYNDINEYIKEKTGQSYETSILNNELSEYLTDTYLTHYTVYKNNHYLPFGYTYNSYITKDYYDKLTPIKKQEAMLQAVVLEDRQDEIPTMPFYNSHIIDYTIGDSDGVEWNNQNIVVRKKDAQITLEIDGLENCENYLYIKGLEFKENAFQKPTNRIAWTLKSPYEKKQIKRNKPTGHKQIVPIKIISQSTKGKEYSNAIEYYTEYYRWYSNQHDYLINLYYSKAPRILIMMTFSNPGIYSYDDIEVICQPMENYEQQIDELKIDTLENVDFHNDNSVYATNEVSGEISLDKPKYLLLTIPYSSGWKAYVDGKEQELLQANTMYMALKLKTGKHKIELTYHTPGKTAGMSISIVSFALFGSIYFIDLGLRNRKKRKEKDLRKEIY